MYAERINVAFISSAAAVNALRMISVVIGSIVRTAIWIYSSSPISITIVPKSSIRAVHPGGTTVVAVASMITAGPSRIEFGS